MNGSQQPAAAALPAHPGLFRWLPFWIFAAFILTLGIISYAVYAHHKKETLHTELGLLSAIADLKVEAIRKWKDERRGDAEVISHAPFFVRGFEQWLQRGMPRDDIREMLLERLKIMQRTYGYQEILMFDARGKPILSTDPHGPAPSPRTLALINQALETQTARFLDIGSNDDPQNMGIASPILATRGGKPGAIGAVYLRTHPSWLPFTLAELLPGNRKSIKVHLVRREGDEAVLMDAVSGEGARFLRRPLSRTELPSVMAVLGEPSNEGIDYSGTPVFTQQRQLPDSEWALVVQVNQEEVYAPLRQLAWLVAGALAVLFFLGETALAMWWRSQRAELAVRHYKVEEAIRISQARFATIFDQSPIGIAVIDSLTGKIHETNRRFAGIAGRTIDELASLDWMSITHPDDVQEDLDNMARLNAGKISGFRMDKRYIRPDGSSVWINMTVAPLTEEQDAAPRHLCMIDDITERKQYEETLHRNAHRLEEAQRIAHIGDWNLDLVKNTLSWSDEIYRIFEFDPEEFLPSYEAFLDTIHPDDRERVDKAYRDSVSNRTPYDIEHRLLMKDGRVKYVSERCETYYREDGTPLRSFGTIHDITERKRMEEHLRISEERLALAVRTGSIGIWDWDITNNRLVWDDSMYRLYSIRSEDFGGAYEAWEKTLHPEDKTHIEMEIQAALRGEHEYAPEFRVIWPDGSVHYLKAASQTLFDDKGKPLRMVGINMDITELKEVENKLKESEALMQTVLKILPVGLWITDETGKIIFGNEAGQRIWAGARYVGIEQFGEYKGWWMGSGKPIEPHDWAVARAIEKGETSLNEEIEIECFDKTHKFILNSALPLRQSNGSISGSVIVNQDITERKQSEIALSEALVKAKRFSDALDNVAAYIYLKNRQHQYIHANRPTLELFRCSAEELVGSDDSRFFPPETVAHLREVDNRVLERGESTHEEIPVDNNLGQRIYWETKAPIYNDQGEIVGLCGISYDITERKQMEAEVRKLNAELEQRVLDRTARLEAANKELESFAYSVSHDLRVPLRAVDGFSQLLLAHHEDRLDEEGRRLLHVVRDNAQKMGQLIDDILAFSRAGRLEMRQTAVDMEAAARDAWQELELSRAGREVHLDIGSLPGAHGDPAMLRQVWINLLGNAIKFTKYRAAAHIEVGGSVQNGEQVFYVKDDGAGFDMQYADKLFGMFQRLHGVEEFEGTGIGLTIVKRIVTRHGGRVWAESKVGEGATLYFALPHPAHQAAT